jgi:lysophospholipase L1-like esterase
MNLNYRQTKRFLASLFVCVLAIALPCTARDGIIVKDGDTVAFLGDSITAGGAAHGRYCRLVIHGLKTKGVNAKGIFAGVSGNKSSDMLLRLDAILSQKPDHLFLSAGVNDIWHGAPDVKLGVFQAKPGMGVSLEHYRVYVPQILERCKTAGTQVILSTITPIGEDPEFKLNKLSEKYNAFLYEQAKKRDLPIAKLNEAMFSRIGELRAEEGGLNARNMLTSDGVHPGTAGHQVMAKGILKAMGLSDKELDALQNEWNRSSKILIVGDRQAHAGGRMGGWCSMVLDGMNLGREMVTTTKVAHKKSGTLAALLPKLNASIEQSRTKYMLVVPPLGDVHEKTPTDDYKKALQSVVDFADKNKLKLVITTIPILNSDAGSEDSIALQAYDSVIRDVCKKQKVALADINTTMARYYEGHPGSNLTIGDERLNHKGGVLLAQSVLKAFGRSADSVEELRRSWDKCGSYTFRYGGSVSFTIPLSEAGKKALQEISDRYHKLREDKFLKLGVYLLLEGDDTENQERIASFDKEWLGRVEAAEPKSHRMAPGSADQDHAILVYTEKLDIDRIEFYRRAYKVGMYVMRKEDPLGRGSY